MKVTVSSLPKENGVPVEINVILFRFPQANLFLAKIIVLDFTGVYFDAIVCPDRVISEKAATSAQKIRVLGLTGIRTNTPLSPKFIIILDALHGYKIRHV